jgi:hypothetical protein
MEQFASTYENVQKQKIEELNNLGSITGKPASLIPRIVSAIAGGALGSISLPQVLGTASNFLIPSIGPLTGYDIFILILLITASIGYGVMELVLRIHRYIWIPRIFLQTQSMKSQAWNRFVRECREATRDLLIETIRLREAYFPTNATYDNKHMFSAPNKLLDSEMPKFNEVLTSVVALKGPQVRNQVFLRPTILGNDWKKSTWAIKINKGDIITGTFAEYNQKRVNCYFFETDNGDSQPASNATYKRENFAADSFSVVSTTDGWGILKFENTSHFRTRQVTFSCEIIRFEISKFCP